MSVEPPFQQSDYSEIALQWQVFESITSHIEPIRGYTSAGEFCRTYLGGVKNGVASQYLPGSAPLPISAISSRYPLVSDGEYLPGPTVGVTGVSLSFCPINIGFAAADRMCTAAARLRNDQKRGVSRHIRPGSSRVALGERWRG
jgi:hypothetical protein